MWKCPKCLEQVEDSFEVCWSCGTSREGEEDPSFQKEQDSAAALSAPAQDPSQGAISSLGEAAQTADQFARERTSIARAVVSRCPHCGGADLVLAVQLSQPAQAGSVGLQYRSLLILVGTEPLFADLCKGCGTIVRFYVRETERDWIRW